ncbi:hypothetical protein SEA_OCTOBIEN14_59 [Gordonia phage Octobien14]|uniref:Uncharacterized protein n=1 Tax=Gordonia phage Octobien14 TaxID=2483673 RepID=A0A3G3M9X3_9CAUD|nr:hypothetical protein L3Y22_gp059 [Gordonia phage Octobien14]AYR03205.1 hypothetical protein SEA_OCTOBIEN14_59 [Gordonia phage Octobien14]
MSNVKLYQHGNRIIGSDGTTIESCQWDEGEGFYNFDLLDTVPAAARPLVDLPPVTDMGTDIDGDPLYTTGNGPWSLDETDTTVALAARIDELAEELSITIAFHDYLLEQKAKDAELLRQIESEIAETVNKARIDRFADLYISTRTELAAQNGREYYVTSDENLRGGIAAVIAAVIDAVEQEVK